MSQRKIPNWLYDIERYQIEISHSDICEVCEYHLDKCYSERYKIGRCKNRIKRYQIGSYHKMSHKNSQSSDVFEPKSYDEVKSTVYIP